MSNVDNNSVNNVSVSGEESRLELYVNRRWKEVKFEEKLELLPVDWSWRALGDVTVCLDYVRVPLSQKDRSNKKGNTPYWGANNIVDYVDGFLLDGTHLLLGEDAAPFFDKTKPVAFVVEGKIWPNNHIHVLTTDEDYKYLAFQLNRFDYGLVLNTKDRPKLTQGAMKGIPVSVPTKKEQSLIAQVLSTQEAQVADLRNLAALERKRLEWLSDELLSGRLRVEEDPTAESVVVSRNEKGEPGEVLLGVRVVRNREWKTVELNGKEVGIPNDWSINTLRNLFRFVNGSAFKPSDWKSKGTKIVRIQNLSNPKAEYNYTNKKLSDFVAINSGDILMSWSGTIDIFRWGEGLAALNQHIFRVDIESETDNLFAEVILKKTIDHLRNQAHGATMVHIRKGAVEEAQCVTPPLPEQSLIAQVLTAQETQASELARLADLEQKRLEWLSDELLSGRLRIKVPA